MVKVQRLFAKTNLKIQVCGEIRGLYKLAQGYAFNKGAIYEENIGDIGWRSPQREYATTGERFRTGSCGCGTDVEIISLNKVEVKGCIGCNACRYGKPCVQKDGFNELVPKIKAADLIVFASPLLFWTISSKLKAFIERFYCIAEEDPTPPLGRYEKYPVKDAALLMTSADDLFWTYEQAVSYY